MQGRQFAIRLVQWTSVSGTVKEWMGNGILVWFDGSWWCRRGVLQSNVVSTVLYGICRPKFSSYGVAVWLLFQLLTPPKSCVLVDSVEISINETDPTDWPYRGCRIVCCREDGLKSSAAPDVRSRAEVIAKLWAHASNESHFQVVCPIVGQSSRCWWQIEACFNTAAFKNPIILPRDHHVPCMIVQEYHEIHFAVWNGCWAESGSSSGS